ncbi:unnamed protein product [Cochlearia groenlandica]
MRARSDNIKGISGEEQDAADKLPRSLGVAMEVEFFPPPSPKYDPQFSDQTSCSQFSYTGVIPLYLFQYDLWPDICIHSTRFREQAQLLAEPLLIFSHLKYHAGLPTVELTRTKSISDITRPDILPPSLATPVNTRAKATKAMTGTSLELHCRVDSFDQGSEPSLPKLFVPPDSPDQGE